MANMSNLASRFLVALLALPLILFLIYQKNAAYIWGLVFASTLMAMYEFFTMTLPDLRDRWASVAMGAVVVTAFYWLGNRPESYLLAMVLAIALPFLYYLFRFGNMDTVAKRITFTVAGIFYGGILLSFVPLLKRDISAQIGADLAGHLIVLLLSTAWLSDTGGYFAGKALGKRKLYAAVSPNKTWVGSVSGALCAMGGGGIMKLFFLDIPWLDILLLSGVGSVLGQFGDLIESLIKRSIGIKNSGTLLPGHGGILDRIDAVILIAPYFYLYLSFRGVDTYT